MGLVITKQADIDAYFDNKVLSQSRLKTLLKGMDSFLANQENDKQLYYNETGHFIIGSAVDCKLTGEEGEFDKQYYVSQIEKKPSDVEMSILNMVFDELIERGTDVKGLYGLSSYEGDILTACNEHEWQSRWKDETRVQRIVEVGSIYFEDLKNAYGKQVLDVTQLEIIDSIVMSLTTNLRTKEYFDRESQQRNTTVDFYYQLPIYFQYRDIDCKALLDLLIVIKDEKGKIVAVRGVDLKTMSGNTTNFHTSLKARRYDIQAAWYTLAIMMWLKDNNYVEQNISIQPFEFIVESTTQQGNPLIYVCTKNLLQTGRSGRPELSMMASSTIQTGQGKLIKNKQNKEIFLYPIKYNQIKGVENLIDDYIWFEENDWKQEKVVAENNGVLEIDWNGII